MSVDKSAVAAAREANSPLVRAQAWLATARVRAWLSWAALVPPVWRDALVPGWRYLFPFLYHWVRCKRHERAGYARQFLSDMSGPTSRGLVRGRSLTRLFQLVEHAAVGGRYDPAALPPAEVQEAFRDVNPAASEEAKPLHPGPPRPLRSELDHEGKFVRAQTLTDGSKVVDGEQSMLERHARQMQGYTTALQAWEDAVLRDAEQRQKPVTWRKVAADTVAMWSAMGLLPPDVIE